MLWTFMSVLWSSRTYLITRYDLVMASRHFSTGLFSEVVFVSELDLSQASIKCPNYYKGDSSDFPMIEGLMLDFVRALLSILFSNPAGALNYCAETTPSSTLVSVPSPHNSSKTRIKCSKINWFIATEMCQMTFPTLITHGVHQAARMFPFFGSLLSRSSRSLFFSPLALLWGNGN